MTRRRSPALQYPLKSEPARLSYYTTYAPMRVLCLPLVAPGRPRCRWRQRPLRVVALALLAAFCCHEWPWNSCTTGQLPGARGGFPCTSPSWGASAASGFDGRFLGRQITHDAIRLGTPALRTPDRQLHPSIDDDFLEDEEPLEIWGDLDDRR